MATSRKTGAPTAPLPPIARHALRDHLDSLDNCVDAFEALLDLVMPYTAEEAARASLPRESVSDVLAPLTRDLRKVCDAGWALVQTEHNPIEGDQP